MTTTSLLNLHDDLCRSAKNLMVLKNNDYTSNSGDPFANFRGSTYLGINPVLGIMLRMQDKLMRVRTFTEKGELKVKDESVKDAFIDLINYTVLMYGFIEDSKSQAATAEQSAVSTERPMYSGASAKEWLATEEDARRTASMFGVTSRGC